MSSHVARIDTAKLLAAVALVMVSVFAYYRMPEEQFLVRFGLLLGGVVGALVLGYLTAPGHQFVGYLQDVQQELRKVAWTGRPQTVQMTMLVMAMVVLVAILLGILDWLLGLFMGWFLNW